VDQLGQDEADEVHVAQDLLHRGAHEAGHLSLRVRARDAAAVTVWRDNRVRPCRAALTRLPEGPR
jgi:hypothetical protein